MFSIFLDRTLTSTRDFKFGTVRRYRVKIHCTAYLDGSQPSHLHNTLATEKMVLHLQSQVNQSSGWKWAVVAHICLI